MSRSPARELLRVAAGGSTKRRRDLTTTVYGAVLIVATVVAVVLHGVDVTLGAAQRSAGLALGVGLLGVGACFGTARSLGPLAMSPSVSRWLGSSPLPRADLLRGKALAHVLLVTVCGVLLGVVAGLTASGGLVPCGVGAVVGGMAGAGSGAMATWVQVAERPALIRHLSAGLVALGLATCGLSTVRPHVVPVPVALVCLAVLGCAALVVLGTGVILFRRWLTRAPLGTIRASGERVHAWMDAAASLDVSGVGARSELQRDRSVGSFPSGKPRSSSLVLDLVRRDVVALGRRRSVLAGRLAACAGAWLVGRLFGPTAGAVALSIASVMLASSLTPRLRTWLASTALWRMVPQDPRRVSWALVAVPTLVVVMVAGFVGWAIGLGWGGLAVAFGAMTFVLRRHRRPDLEIGQTLDTPLGQLPLGLAMSLLYGSEATIVVLAVGLSSSWPVALLLSVGWFLATAWSARPVASRGA